MIQPDVGVGVDVDVLARVIGPNLDLRARCGVRCSGDMDDDPAQSETGLGVPPGSGDNRRPRDRRLAMWAAAAAAVLGLVGAVSCGAAVGRDSQVVKTLGAASAPEAPSPAAIAAAMGHTVESGVSPSVTFEPVGTPVSVGSGPNALTAIVGRRSPSADGAGQLVFFWAGSRFVGWDADSEAVRIDSIVARDASVAVTYEGFTVDDPICCPSQPPIVVDYRWDGKRVVVTTPGPPVKRGQAVTYTP